MNGFKEEQKQRYLTHVYQAEMLFEINGIMRQSASRQMANILYLKKADKTNNRYTDTFNDARPPAAHHRSFPRGPPQSVRIRPRSATRTTVYAKRCGSWPPHKVLQLSDQASSGPFSSVPFTSQFRSISGLSYIPRFVTHGRFQHQVCEKCVNTNTKVPHASPAKFRSAFAPWILPVAYLYSLEEKTHPSMHDTKYFRSQKCFTSDWRNVDNNLADVSPFRDSARAINAGLFFTQAVRRRCLLAPAGV